MKLSEEKIDENENTDVRVLISYLDTATSPKSSKLVKNSIKSISADVK